MYESLLSAKILCTNFAANHVESSLCHPGVGVHFEIKQSRGRIVFVPTSHPVHLVYVNRSSRSAVDNKLYFYNRQRTRALRYKPEQATKAAISLTSGSPSSSLSWTDARFVPKKLSATQMYFPKSDSSTFLQNCFYQPRLEAMGSVSVAVGRWARYSSQTRPLLWPGYFVSLLKRSVQATGFLKRIVLTFNLTDFSYWL